MVQQIAVEVIPICSGYFLDIPLPDTRAIITFRIPWFLSW